MFPFQGINGYINPHFPYQMNYQTYRIPQMDGNSYFYPYNYQNMNVSHQSSLPGYLPRHQVPYFFDKNQNFLQERNFNKVKRKRITKKLILTQVKKKIRSLGSQFKSKRRSFKYFDPSRAPPITTLRNNSELMLDIKAQEKKLKKHQNISFDNDSCMLNFGNDLIKLQILTRQPNENNYPFLICKKRKCHRNLKRRYSVAYFEQRAFYITNKQPIPPELHPKNKIRKSRSSKKYANEVSDQSSNSYESEQLSRSQEGDDEFQSQMFRQKNAEPNPKLYRFQNRLKQEIRDSQSN